MHKLIFDLNFSPLFVTKMYVNIRNGRRAERQLVFYIFLPLQTKAEGQIVAFRQSVSVQFSVDRQSFNRFMSFYEHEKSI